MNPLRTLLCASLALAPGAALAVSLDLGASNLGGNAVVDHSGAGVLSFDVQVENVTPIELVVHLDPGEQNVAWNGWLERPTDRPFLTGYEVALSGATLAPGSVRESLARDVGGVSVSGGDTAQIAFAEPESAFAIGAPPAILPAGASDWQISAPAPGATFTMTLTPLPEPGGAARVAGAALAVALQRLRARRHSGLRKAW